MISPRRLARSLVDQLPDSARRSVRRHLTRVHADSAARAAAIHAVSRRATRVRGHEWGFFTLYLPEVEHPLYARPGTSDLHAFHSIFGSRRHAVDLGFVPRLVFDLGANVGYAAIDFALRYPGVTVVAVEPEPSNLEVLRRNVAPYGQIEVVNAGVWPRPAALQLEDPETFGHVSFRVREAAPSRRTVAAVTVPELMESVGADSVDLIKVDIEGSELELFSERTEWLESVRVVIAEFHDSFRPGCKEVGDAALTRAGLRFLQDVGGTQYYVRP